ncbi:hypothetical protein EDB85DRAFT_1902763 [Lactarius pseudohatsudake]|nr:hypothetical protein EDB85DRAFT_1902763 [Lactarius pseudohatsudake]
MASRRGVVMGLARHHGVAVVADSRVAKGGCGSHGPACGEAETVGTRGVGAQWALLASAGETEATEGMGLVRNTMKQKNKQENYLDDWAEAQLVGRLFTMSVAGIVAAGVGVEGRKRWRSVKSGVPMRLTTSEGPRREKPRPRVSQKWLKVDVTSIMQHLNSFNKRKREQLPNTPQKRIMLSIGEHSIPQGRRTIDLACAKWTLTLSVLSHPRRPRPRLVKKPTCPKKTVHHANARYASVPERTSRSRLARVLIGVRWHSISSCENCVHESSTNIEGLGPGPEDTLGNRAASATEAEEVLPDTP